MLRILRMLRRITCPLKAIFSVLLCPRASVIPISVAQRTALAPLISVSSMRNFFALGWVATATAVS